MRFCRRRGNHRDRRWSVSHGVEGTFDGIDRRVGENRIFRDERGDPFVRRGRGVIWNFRGVRGVRRHGCVCWCVWNEIRDVETNELFLDIVRDPNGWRRRTRDVPHPRPFHEKRAVRDGFGGRRRRGARWSFGDSIRGVHGIETFDHIVPHSDSSRGKIREVDGIWVSFEHACVIVRDLRNLPWFGLGFAFVQPRDVLAGKFRFDRVHDIVIRKEPVTCHDIAFDHLGETVRGVSQDSRFEGIVLFDGHLLRTVGTREQRRAEESRDIIEFSFGCMCVRHRNGTGTETGTGSGNVQLPT